MLRVTMPLWFAGNSNRQLAGGNTADRYPEVTLDLVLDNRHVDFNRRRLRLALRVAKPCRRRLLPGSRTSLRPSRLARLSGETRTPPTSEEAMPFPPSCRPPPTKRNLEINASKNRRKKHSDAQSGDSQRQHADDPRSDQGGAGIAYQPLWSVRRDLAGRQTGSACYRTIGVRTDQLNAVVFEWRFEREGAQFY